MLVVIFFHQIIVNNLNFFIKNQFSNLFYIIEHWASVFFLFINISLTINIILKQFLLESISMFNKAGTPRTNISKMKDNNSIDILATGTNLSKMHSSYPIPQGNSIEYIEHGRERAKQSINEIIDILKAKRRENATALREVQKVNSELASTLAVSKNESQPFKELRSKPSYTTQYSPGDSNDLNEHFRYKTEENKKNNDLEDRLAKSQRQNEQLKNENSQLKKEVSRLKLIPKKVMEELEELKKQNQNLRKQTILLLKRKN